MLWAAFRTVFVAICMGFAIVLGVSVLLEIFFVIVYLGFKESFVFVRQYTTW